MTIDRIALKELVEKGSDADFLREIIAFIASRMMELGVEGLTGAATASARPPRHIGPSQRPMVAAAIRTAFTQETAEAAHEEWRAVADRLRERFRKLAELMDEAEYDVLAHMAFPKHHRRQLHSVRRLISPLRRSSGRRTAPRNGAARGSARRHQAEARQSN